MQMVCLGCQARHHHGRPSRHEAPRQRGRGGRQQVACLPSAEAPALGLQRGRQSPRHQRHKKYHATIARVVLNDKRYYCYDVKHDVGDSKEFKVPPSRILPRVSPYEQQRLDRIARNEAKLSSMGLGTTSAKDPVLRVTRPRVAPPLPPPRPKLQRNRAKIDYAEPGDDPLEDNKEAESKASIESESHEEEEDES